MVLESTAVDRLCVQLIGLMDSEQILNSTVKILTDECGVHMSWIADPVDGGVMIRRTSGNLTQVSRGVVLRNGRGLGGKVYQSGELQAVDNYVGSAMISHEYDAMVTPEGVEAMVAAPIVFANHNYGVLFGGYRGSHECGDRAKQLLDGVAQRCAEALFFEERLRAEAQTAVREERRRAAKVQHELDSALTGLVRDLRETEMLIKDDYSLAERFRKIERQAVESATQLRSSLSFYLGDAVEADASEPDAISDQPHLVKKLIANREYDVLRRVAMGETNQEIALAMSLSCNTIKTYLRNAMSKLGARNRIEAIVQARELGLL